MKVYRENEKWYVLYDDCWWWYDGVCWYEAALRIEENLPAGPQYESSELAFLVVFGKTLEKSLQRRNQTFEGLV